jgi:multiple sugar transport system permease protein
MGDALLRRPALLDPVSVDRFRRPSDQRAGLRRAAPWVPNPVQWDNFRRAWTELPFPTFVVNTIVITILSVIGQVFSASLVAYGFARFKFRGRNLLFYLMLSTMMLPAQVTMIPVFLLWRELRLIDTFAPLTVPAFFGGGAFTIFLLRQFFLTIPRELDEAAMLTAPRPSGSGGACCCPCLARP